MKIKNLFEDNETRNKLKDIGIELNTLLQNSKSIDILMSADVISAMYNVLKVHNDFCINSAEMYSQMTNVVGILNEVK